VAAKDIARVYASSLGDLGQEKKILTEIEEELKVVSELYAGDKDFRNFLLAPQIEKETKKKFIDTVFKGKMSEIMVDFLKVLIDNDRQSAIIETYEALSLYADDVNNRQKVTVITSVALDEPLKNKLIQRLKEVTKKDVILKVDVDQKILGGIIIQVGGTVIDGSLAKDLRNIKHNLLNSKVRSEVSYED
jgi:F-type H+-transporting ATPase subunit delta